MTPPTAVICSYRLGDADGVSVETRKWEEALRRLGFRTRRVAGELGDPRREDTLLPFLAIEPPPGVALDPSAFALAIRDADLVVVENLCSLPINEDAATLARHVLADHAGRVLFHHHDLPWERAHLAHLVDFPPRRPNSLHVTINEQARVSLAERGIEAVTIRNAFDLAPAPGDRLATRRALGVPLEDRLVLQPTRAIPRKEVGRGIRFAEELAARSERPVTYWLTGPAEDGFDDRLAGLLEAARVDVRLGRAARAEDAYAAADVVVFPSSWEGFGNPVIESVIARRPVVTATYPALEELRGLGLDLFSVDDVARVDRWMRDPSRDVLDRNLEVVREHFDVRDLPRRLTAAFATVGWGEW